DGARRAADERAVRPGRHADPLPAVRAIPRRHTMRRTIAALAAGLGAVALAAVGMGATGCTTSSAGSAKKDEPATVEKLPGDQVRITLTADAARRLDIQTGTIGGGPASILAAGGTSTTTLPYAPLPYHPPGPTPADTVPAPAAHGRAPGSRPS